MPKKGEKIIIDTNLWISFLLTRNFKKLDNKIKAGTIRIVFSHKLIEEFLTVVHRPKFRKYFSKSDVEELIDLFDVYGEIFEVKSNVDVCRDKKDNFILSLAKDSQADYLITGDNDLLELKTFGRTKIVLISDYLKKAK